jgi:hypothetical protein
MSNLTSLAGRASHVNYFSSTSGSINRGKGRIRTRQTTSFRVDNHPVSFYGSPSLSDGEMVTVVGIDQSSVFKALALRNDVTEVTYFYTNYPLMVIYMNFLGGVVIFIGLSFLSGNQIFGLFLIGLGIWIIYSRRKRNQELIKLVEKMPPVNSR